MTKDTYPDGNMIFELSPEDIKAAIRQFIRKCHPEAEDFDIKPYQGAQRVEVPLHYTATK